MNSGYIPAWLNAQVIVPFLKEELDFSKLPDLSFTLSTSTDSLSNVTLTLGPEQYIQPNDRGFYMFMVASYSETYAILGLPFFSSFHIMVDRDIGKITFKQGCECSVRNDGYPKISTSGPQIIDHVTVSKMNNSNSVEKPEQPWECPDDSTFDWEGYKCVCNEGFEWDGQSLCLQPLVMPDCPVNGHYSVLKSVCVCDVGYELNNKGECLFPECPENGHWKEVDLRCECDEGHEWKEGKCVIPESVVDEEIPELSAPSFYGISNYQPCNIEGARCANTFFVCCHAKHHSASFGTTCQSPENCS